MIKQTLFCMLISVLLIGGFGLMGDNYNSNLLSFKVGVQSESKIEDVNLQTLVVSENEVLKMNEMLNSLKEKSELYEGYEKDIPLDFARANNGTNKMTMGKCKMQNGLNVASESSSPFRAVSTKAQMNAYEFFLNFEGKTYTLKFDFSKQSQNFMINEQAKKWGRDGNHAEAVFALDSLIKMGVEPRVAFEFVFPSINKKLDKILNEVNILPKDSKVIFTPNFVEKFVITNEKCGYIVDRDKLLLQMLEKFRFSPQISLSLEREKVEPTITKEDNVERTQLLSRFSTSIASSTAERQNNVKLALKQFNGMVVEPSQEVSFNKTTGRRTVEKGYKEAHIILDGLFVDGTGGGVCQSSTTLYNALLLADNVEILEANRHSMPVSYVPIGFDAMVAYGSSDLKFKNIGQDPLYIRTYSKNGSVCVEVYGRKTDFDITKKCRSEIIKEIKSKGDIIKKDTKGEFAELMDENGYYRQKKSKEGYEVQTYIDYFKNGELINTKKIRHTTYPAQRGIVYKGKPKLVVNEVEETADIL